MSTSVQCNPPPLLTSSPAGSPQNDNSILSQRVHGDLVSSCHCGRVRVKSLSVSTDHTDYLKLFRIHVSRKAAGNGRAVLEGLGLDQTTIDQCISARPLNDEKIVQAGLIRWSGGNAGTQPPTWGVLIAAMEYALIHQQDIEGLKTSLNQPAVTEGMLSLPCGVLLAVTVTVRGHGGAFLGLHVPYTIYLHARSDLCPLHSSPPLSTLSVPPTVFATPQPSQPTPRPPQGTPRPPQPTPRPPQGTPRPPQGTPQPPQGTPQPPQATPQPPHPNPQPPQPTPQPPQPTPQPPQPTPQPPQPTPCCQLV